MPSPTDSTLKELSNLLPEFCTNSRAKNTKRKYSYAFENFCKWCNNFKNINPLPASDYYVSLYLVHLSKNAKSFAKIEEAFYAISWAHKLAGFTDPCKSDLCVSVKEGSHRMIGNTVVNKKEPITPEILNKIVDRFDNDNLSDVRICCMCLISYAGFLRYSELANLRRCDLEFCATHVTLFIQKSKTDHYKEGTEVLIARTHKNTCPVNMLLKYLKLSEISSESSEFIFRSISFYKKSNTYKLKGKKPLSYTRAREILLSALESIGLDKSKFGLHSLRSGGATASASAGVKDRLFKKHGRWRSDSAKDGYVKEDIKEKLSVTKQLGI